jgi:hypothetical protein
MSKFTLKSTLIAAAISFSMLAPAAQAQAPRPSAAGATVGHTIAEQGNVALRVIRAELKAAAAAKPFLPRRARATRISAPAAGSLPATAAAAE